MYGNLDNDNIKRIQDADIVTLDQIAVSAYSNLKPKQRIFADNYLTTNQDKKALINAGYSKQNIYNLSVQLKRNTDVCLYISAKQQLDIRKHQAEIDAENKTSEADKEQSKAVCRNIIKDEHASYDLKLKAIDLLAKLNGVYKEAPKKSKNTAYTIELPENMQNSEQNSDNKSNKRNVSNSRSIPDYSGDDDD